MIRTEKIMFTFLLSLCWFGINAQSVRLDLSSESTAHATSSTIDSRLHVTTSNGETHIDISYDGLNAELFQVEVYANDENVYERQLKENGPSPTYLLKKKKVKVETFLIDKENLVSWFRVLRLLPCIEAQYNSNGSWYVEFDCYESVAAPLNTIQVEDGAPTTVEGTAVRVLPVTDQPLNLENISITKF
ncbi:MAG: hypothetical protein MI974_04685 [Chitinophagales bacterium]|nr:hypothetical protein [Chitinophagales bacterium]